MWRLSNSEAADVAEEFRTQISQCRAGGLPLSHADSHHHMHEEWGILSIAMRVCREMEIPEQPVWLNLVVVREAPERANARPILWLLLTDLPIDTPERFGRHWRTLTEGFLAGGAVGRRLGTRRLRR